MTPTPYTLPPETHVPAWAWAAVLAAIVAIYMVATQLPVWIGAVPPACTAGKCVAVVLAEVGLFALVLGAGKLVIDFLVVHDPE